MNLKNQDNPLKLYITEEGELIISIGIERLADCFERCPENNPFDNSIDDYIQLGKVCDYEVFAQDVLQELSREREDGSTILTDLIDKATMNTYYDGTLGCFDGED